MINAAFEQQHHHQVRGEDVFVIHGAATPDVAVLHDGAEGIDGPLFALHLMAASFSK
jgi:hypothetical protein